MALGQYWLVQGSLDLYELILENSSVLLCETTKPRAEISILIMTLQSKWICPRASHLPYVESISLYYHPSICDALAYCNLPVCVCPVILILSFCVQAGISITTERKGLKLHTHVLCDYQT
jgi:hypothetical protein